MSENRTVSIMLFVLGLFLIAIGIGISTVTQTVTRYRNYYGFQIPYQETIQPYVGIGAVMAIFGVIVLIGAFIKTRSKKTVTVKMEIPKTESV
jgi:uncharacterized membrane protein YidH (DUF202 family)